MDKRKQFLILATPAALEGLFLMLLSAVDLFMVSSLGTLSVAAVSIFSQPRMVILCFSRSFSVALTAYVARLKGEKANNNFSACAKQSLLIGFIGSGVLLVFTLIFCKQILLLAGAQQNYLSFATNYAVLGFFSLFFSAPAIILHGILSGLGDTKSVLTANVLGNAVNVLFNIVFIPYLGVIGAGIGTLIGTFSTLIFTLILFINKNHIASLKGHGKWIPEREYINCILPITGGVFTEQAVERVGMFTYSRMVANLGASALGVHNICMGLCDIYYSFAQGMGKASLILAGNDFGKTGGKNIKSIAKISKIESLWTALIAFIICFIFRNNLLEFYHLSGSELILGAEIMLFVSLVSFPEAQAMTHASILRGIGQTAFVAKYSLVSIAILRPIITYILVYSLNLGLHGAWIALCLDQSTRALCSTIKCDINNKSKLHA